MSTARDEVLARIRTALRVAPGAGEPVARGYRQAGTDVGDHDLLVDRFAERVADYRATVRRTDAGGLREAVAAALADGLPPRVEGAGPPTVVVPGDLPDAWLAALDADVVVDPRGHPLTAADLDAIDAVVTAAALGIAETGTIVLDAGVGQGRRALTLVPDVHVCVVRADQVVAGVPEAVASLDATRPQTWISGPSATSDIELDRVEGVHGPRSLQVVVVDA